MLETKILSMLQTSLGLRFLNPLKTDCIFTAAFSTSGSVRSMSTISSSPRLRSPLDFLIKNSYVNQIQYNQSYKNIIIEINTFYPDLIINESYV